jgi:TonB-linked SusC/RagA family outer membrane protein
MKIIRKALGCLILFFLIAALPASVSGQVTASAKYSGTITDEKGEPIIGASILVKGTSVGTITDIDGKYAIEATPGSTLQISYIGFSSTEVKVSNQRTVNLVLKEDTKTLDEVVVIGYGVQKKRDLTGAVSSVKMDDSPVGTFSTISHALSGKAAGLQVLQNSAQPGGGATFRIRGETSINAGNAPLIIIDGFPSSSSASLGSGNRYDAGSYDNVLESINPNDIESIEVLKDASATAIYGSRAGHGVIIITTKRGSTGTPTVSYSGNVAVQHMDNNYEMLNSVQYRDMVNKKDYETWLKDNGQGVYAKYITPNSNPKPFTPRYTDQQVKDAQYTDWFKEVTRTGVQQSHNVSIKGGTDVSKYMGSINYFSQDGVVKKNAMDRLTANFNNDWQITKYVKAGISLNISRNSYDNVALGTSENEYSGVIASALRFDPAVPVRNEKGDYSIFPDMSQYPNPVSLLEITDKTVKDRLLGSAYVQVEPVKGLILKVNMGADRKNAKRKTYVPTTTMYGARDNGRAYVTSDDNIDYLFGFTATYSKKIDEHTFTGLVGYEYQQFNNEGVLAGNYDFPIDKFLYNNLNAGGTKPDVGSWASKSALGSYFGRINYDYKGKYLLTATLRADGASNFAPDYRWGYFPSVSAGWRFSDESFMSSINDIVSNGKLRVGYGQTGNSNVGNRTLDYFSAGGNWAFGETGYTGMGTSRLGNEKITWETTSEYNFGLDLGFLDNRINLTIEYYDRVISDLLVTGKSLPFYNEITTVAANIGKTQGQGFELTLNTVNIKQKDLEWSTDLTLSKYKDRWKERDPNWKPAVYQSVDDPIRSIFVYKSNGLLQAGEDVPAWQTKLLPGQIKLQNLKDQEGTPNLLDQYDQVLLGSQDPNLFFGFNNTLRYKRFDFNIYFYGELERWRGASYYNSWLPSYTSNRTNMSTQTLNCWREDNQDTSTPSLLPTSYSTGDYFYKKVSFIRCRNIMVGYTLPVPKNVLGNVRAYVNVNNPFVISNYDGIDPESGINNYAYPSVRTFSFGVDIRF